MVQRAHINPELLIWARETIRMSVEEAKSKIHPDVAKWEAREGKPTVSQLRKASRVYKRPMAAFYLPAPPTTFRVPHDYRRIPGEPEPRLSPEFLGEFRAARYRRRIALDVAEEGEISNEVNDWVGSLTTRTNPRRACAGLRAKLFSRMSKTRWKSRYDAFNSWREALESCGVLVTHFSGVKVGEVRGYAITDTPLPVIGLNSSDAVNGRIFTLFHEFAHLLLGKPGVSNLKEFPSTVSANQKIEQWCNEFAAELLVPSSTFLELDKVAATTTERIWSDDEIEELSDLFFVSRLVILARLVTFGKAPQSFYKRKDIEYRKAAEDALEGSSGFIYHHQKIVRGVGKLFARIVVGAYDRESITASDLAEYLGMRLKHLGNVRTALSTMRAGTGDTTD